MVESMKNKRRIDISRAIYALAELLFRDRRIPEQAVNAAAGAQNATVTEAAIFKDNNAAYTALVKLASKSTVGFNSEVKQHEIGNWYPGVYVILGEPRSGKSTLAMDTFMTTLHAREPEIFKDKSQEEITDALKQRYFKIDEPLDDIFSPEDVDYRPAALARAVTNMLKSDGHVFLLDSVRSIISSLGGPLERGGLATAFKELLTLLQNIFVSCGKVLILVYTTKEEVVDSIIASSSGMAYVVRDIKGNRTFAMQYREAPYMGPWNSDANLEVCKKIYDKLKPLEWANAGVRAIDPLPCPIRSLFFLRLYMLGNKSLADYVKKGLARDEIFLFEKRGYYQPLELSGAEVSEGAGRLAPGDDASVAELKDSDAHIEDFDTIN